jgi:hypothetical protein
MPGKSKKSSNFTHFSGVGYFFRRRIPIQPKRIGVAKLRYGLAQYQTALYSSYVNPLTALCTIMLLDVIRQAIPAIT